MKKIFLLYIAALAIFAFPIILFRKELIAGFKKQKLLPLPGSAGKEALQKSKSGKNFTPQNLPALPQTKEKKKVPEK